MKRRNLVGAITGLGLAAGIRLGVAAAGEAADGGGGGGGGGGHAGAPGRIDVHSHYLPAPYQKALLDAGMRTADGGFPVPGWSAEDHLRSMARRGVACSMLSISSPHVQFLDAARAARLAREVNEAGAQLCSDHPGKFGVLAVLPLPDVAASLAELAYACDRLGVDGVGLETNARGLYLGDPAFAPLFDELERRKATVFLHPTSPACFEQIGMGFPAPMIEFPFDTARTVTSLLYNSTLVSRPNIKVILSHGGGALPLLVSRIAGLAQMPIVTPRPEKGAAEVLEQVRRLYFDLALSANPATLGALLQVTDHAHILFGTDFPWAPAPAIDGNTASFGKLMDGLTAEQRRMVEYRNAAELFPRLKAWLTSPAD
jgi:predicted TIM-barrel fold metal-dependent hydrolase